FFFQAEDGIRDFYVTGVQTCALPIYEYALRAERGGDRESRFHLRRVDLHGVEADLGRRQTAEPVLDQRCGPAVVVDEAAFGELRKCPGPQSGALFERFPVRAHLERIGHLTGAERLPQEIELQWGEPLRQGSSLLVVRA